MYVATKNQSVKSTKNSNKTKGGSAKKGGSSSTKRLTQEHWNRIIGILLLLFSIITFVSILSFWFTHTADEAYVQGNAESAGNLCRGMGAYLGFFFCNILLGFFAIGIPVITLLIGTKLTFRKEKEKEDQEKRKRRIWIITTIFVSMVWLSMFLAYFQVGSKGINANSSEFPAGGLGILVTGWLVRITGGIGSFFILLALLLIILFLCYNILLKKLE